MMRVYHSISAAMVKSLAFFQNRTGADKKRSRVSARAGQRSIVGWSVHYASCWPVRSLLLQALALRRPLRALRRIGRRAWPFGCAAITCRGTVSNPAQSYDRYENWIIALASGSLLSEGNIFNRRHSASNSAHAVMMPPAPLVLNAPSNLMVNSTSSTVIQLSWTAPGGTVAHYLVERSQSIYGPFT